MQRLLTAFAAFVFFAGSAPAAGLLIPVEKKLPPLAMLNHKVDIAIEDQVAVTRIEQTFRNHTDRELEATYIFPVPKGASVRKFSMWVNGKEVPGELVEADKARKIYTDIVQRTMDPGLLEYMGNNLLRLRVYPVPPKGDQKIAISYTSIAPSDNGLIEYVYPLKGDGKAASTLEKFSINLTLKSQHPIQNIYSPSHGITMSRPNDRQAIIGFEKDQAHLDRDFQLYYTAGDKDVGITALSHRPNPSTGGYFMLLVSPRAELSKSQQVPRDMVFVLDTSGSMRGKRMTQAQNALKYCLTKLSSTDRFAVINFATTVNKYVGQLQPASADNIDAAKKWVDDLEATGGTAIDDALAAAIAMRTGDESRTFNIVFFTDGQPTIGETNAEKILANVNKKNTGNTRIFTFGVGDDVNAALLDQLADNTRALSTYVRETEEIEVKVSSLYTKISNPVLANLRLSLGEGVSLSEIYPPQLPDLFHGTQLVVLGRYTGKGHTAVKLIGTVGKEVKEFVYELNFAEKTSEDKSFVEDLWARRKVGYLLDQIRVNGEKKELVDEVVVLAKRYGITTPYTSYLMVPDGVVPPVVTTGPKNGVPDVRFHLPAALAPAGPGKGPVSVEGWAKDLKGKMGAKGGPGGGFAGARNEFEDRQLRAGEENAKGDASALKIISEAKGNKATLERAQAYFMQGKFRDVQGGELGVNFAVQNNYLRNQCQVVKTASRMVQNRNCIEVGGVWIDDNYDAKAASLTIKAMSPAYFRILEKRQSMREVFQLGNHVIWVSPSGTALIIDQNSGREEIADAEIDRLFQTAKK